MKRRYHIPERFSWQAQLPNEEKARLQQVVRAAVRRAVAGLAGEGAEIVSADYVAGEAARELFSPSRYRAEAGAYTVSSYDDGGAPTEVPLEGAITFVETPIFGVRDEVVEREPPFQRGLVLRLPGNVYANVDSPHYAVSGNVANAYDWGRALFGAETWVMVSNTGRGGEAVYYVAALDRVLTEADLHVQTSGGGPRGQFAGEVLQRLPGGYEVVAVGFPGGGYTAPTAGRFESFEQMQRAARGWGAALPPELVRASVFEPGEVS